MMGLDLKIGFCEGSGDDDDDRLDWIFGLDPKMGFWICIC